MTSEFFLSGPEDRCITLDRLPGSRQEAEEVIKSKFKSLLSGRYVFGMSLYEDTEPDISYCPSFELQLDKCQGDIGLNLIEALHPHDKIMSTMRDYEVYVDGLHAYVKRLYGQVSRINLYGVDSCFEAVNRRIVLDLQGNDGRKIATLFIDIGGLSFGDPIEGEECFTCFISVPFLYSALLLLKLVTLKLTNGSTVELTTPIPDTDVVFIHAPDEWD